MNCPKVCRKVFIHLFFFQSMCTVQNSITFTRKLETIQEWCNRTVYFCMYYIYIYIYDTCPAAWILRPALQHWHWLWFKASRTLGLKHFRSRDQLLWRDAGRAHACACRSRYTHTQIRVRLNASSVTPDGYRYTVKSGPRLKPGLQWRDSVCSENLSRRPGFPLWNLSGSASDLQLHCLVFWSSVVNEWELWCWFINKTTEQPQFWIWLDIETSTSQIMSRVLAHQHTEAVSAVGGGAVHVTKHDSQQACGLIPLGASHASLPKTTFKYTVCTVYTLVVAAIIDEEKMEDLCRHTKRFQLPWLVFVWDVSLLISNTLYHLADLTQLLLRKLVFKYRVLP